MFSKERPFYLSSSTNSKKVKEGVRSELKLKEMHDLRTLVVLSMLGLATLSLMLPSVQGLPTDCELHSIDMLEPADHSEEGAPSTATNTPTTTTTTTATPTTPTTATPTTPTTEVASTPTTEPPVDVNTLKTTLERSTERLHRTVVSLHQGLVSAGGLKLPKRPALCFYARRSKEEWRRTSSRVRLQEDLATVEKYEDYFTRVGQQQQQQQQQEQQQLQQYGDLTRGVGELAVNLSRLVRALDEASERESMSVQPSGSHCFDTSDRQQAITLFNLRSFLKDYLLRDLNSLK